jgi:hypothetical protein
MGRVFGLIFLGLSLGCGITSVVVARSITIENPEEERLIVVCSMLGCVFVFTALGSWLIMKELIDFTLTKKITNSKDNRTRMKQETLDLVTAFTLAVVMFWMVMILFAQSKLPNYYFGGIVLSITIICSAMIFYDHTYFFRAIFGPLLPKEANAKPKETTKLLPEKGYFTKQVLNQAATEFDQF